MVALFAAWSFATSVFAHPIHTSLAEADYNRETQKLEVALRVFADDFEAALSERAREKISFSKTPAERIDALARAYVGERFTVKTRDGAIARQEWVGRKLDDAANELWLFFEVPLPGGVDGARMHHAVLTDQFRNQVNSIQLRDGPRKLTLMFLANHREKTVRFPPTAN